MANSIPQNIGQYLEQRLGELDKASGLALALDPERRLKLAVNSEFIDASGKRWRMVRYRNDDLTLRRNLMSDSPQLIWAQPPITPADAMIDLSYLPDLVTRLANEQVIDLSLHGVLQTLVPEETFPKPSVDKYAAYFADRLPDLIGELKELRAHSRFKPPLSREHIQALALCCSHPNLQAGNLLFSETDLQSALVHYLFLIIESKLAEDEANLLRELARQSPLSANELKRLEVWLQPDPEDLLRTIYLRWIAHVTGLAENVQGQVFSTGLCECDPRELEREWEIVCHWLQRNEQERTQLFVRVEEQLRLEQLEQIDALLPHNMSFTSREQLQQFPPAALWRLVVKTSAHIVEAQSEAVTSFDLPATPFADIARNGLQLLELCIQTQRRTEMPKNDINLRELLNAYISTEIYTLELHVAWALNLVRQLPDANLQERMGRYLAQLEQRVRDQLHMWDTRLAALLKTDYEGYRRGGLCSIHAIGDLLPERGRMPKDAALWLLVFDGMRMDTWQKTVLPILREAFAVEQTETYLCMLPSYTTIARRALLAGVVSEDWRDWNGKPTDKEDTLLAVNLELDKETARRNLQTIVPAEGVALATNRKPINLVIYKLSDNWIHKFDQDLVALNDEIERRLKNQILPVLRNAVKPQDTVLILSDHGFVELHPENKLDVAVGDESDTERSDVEFRVTFGKQVEGAFPLKFSDGSEASLAIGKTWFLRPKGHRKRYAHGGVSFAEMVVPAARLRVKQIEECRLQLIAPDQLTLVEETITPVMLTLRNVGTVSVTYTVTLMCNLLDLPVKPDHIPPAHLEAGESRPIALQVTAKNGLSVLRVQVAYYRGDHHPQPLRRNIPVKVEARTDQIKLVGLDI